MSQATVSLAIPGVVHVGHAESPEGAVVATGPAAGWITPKGITEWSQELSVIVRSDLSEALREELGLTLPENRIAKSRHPLAHRAAETLLIVAVTSDVVPKLVERGVRVHTVGYDRVTGGFVYFGEGGSDKPINIHGDLLEMIAPALEGGSSNEDIQRHLDGFIDRLLRHASNGALDELSVELANALPRLSTDARGLQGVDLDAFEAEATSNAEASKKHEEGARRLAAALSQANGASTVDVPLFGQARRKTRPAMEILVGGEPVTLPAQATWVVQGAIVEAKPEAKPEPKVVTPAAAPVSAKPTPAAGPSSKREPKPAAKHAEPRLVTPSPKLPSMLGARQAEPKVATPTAPKVATPAAPKVATPAAPKVATPAAPKVAAPIEPVPVEPPPAPAPEPAPVQVAPVVAVQAAPVVAVGAPTPAPAPAPAPVEEKPVVVAKPEPKPVVEAKPLPAEKPAAEAKLAASKPEPKPEKPKPAEEALAPAEPPKSNAMIFVLIALLVVAAIAFFLMKK
ncbi:MAG: hypothetical protein HYV09_41225 [Deltaproteobacteria bacterium]|nr:hypothetical protein [Deltaproteobacteria bacterium]